MPLEGKSSCHCLGLWQQIDWKSSCHCLAAIVLTIAATLLSWGVWLNTPMFWPTYWTSSICYLFVICDSWIFIVASNMFVEGLLQQAIRSSIFRRLEDSSLSYSTGFLIIRPFMWVLIKKMEIRSGGLSIYRQMATLDLYLDQRWFI